MKMWTRVLCAGLLMVTASSMGKGAAKTAAMRSIETGYTVMKVRAGRAGKKPFIAAASYEGTILGVNYDGKVLWKNALSGYMVHDLWCADITGDGSDEVLVANADGKVYCLNAKGTLLWDFVPNDGGHCPPMYGICVVHDAKKNPYVVCGGLDQSFYYLSSNGKLIKEVKSTDYSTLIAWGKGKKEAPPGARHTVNFLRPIPQADGSEALAVHGSNNHMQVSGAVYLFHVLDDQPFRTIKKLKNAVSVGDWHVCDPDGDGEYEVLMGTSSLGKEAVIRYGTSRWEGEEYNLNKIGAAGYRVAQCVTIPDGDSFRYFMLCGSYAVLAAPDFDPKKEENFFGTYAFNDLWKDEQGRILLASSQSGGSCIHVLDPTKNGWKEAFSNLTPPGKIESIRSNVQSCRAQLESYNPCSWQRKTDPVYLTWAKKINKVSELAEKVMKMSNSPVFLNQCGTDKEKWDRSSLGSEIYEKKRDRRMKYTKTQKQVLDNLLPNFDNAPGISYWVGHGNDPYMFQLETTKKVLDGAKGKKTVLILPELGETHGEYSFVIDDLFCPLAAYCAQKNGTIYFRSKNIFWQGDIYGPVWKDVVSGKYAKSIVPAMEETTDKTMELSLAGRMGLWAAGSVDAWGMRCSRDNPSFDRSRQHSYQRLPNHFLRTFVYSLACGSTYVNNTYVDEDHMGLAWELVAKGALFVPRREEIVSFSPVHVSMKEPDEHYLFDGTQHKWNVSYNREFEENNPFVFSRLNASWPAAPNSDWDFSRFAAGVKDRRQNFIPPYNNGMVLITPPQHGVFADPAAPRGLMVDKLHPLYKDILKEYITDGRNYYSADGKKTFAADAYYKQVEADIKDGAKKLPVTVEGDAGWVCAQIAPKHLRLTLVDGGYLNPSDKKVRVQFNTVNPVKVTDVLSGKCFIPDASGSIEVEIPCGLFRFIDIELSVAL